jgi:Holliday junction resolvase RusA-like endonuclease
VNHYRGLRRGGKGFYVKEEAKAYKAAVAVLAPKDHVPEPYRVRIEIYLGPGQRGDVDNFAKVVLDGLVGAGVLRSDAAVEELTISKARDRNNPRTEIEVTQIGGETA